MKNGSRTVSTRYCIGLIHACLATCAFGQIQPAQAADDRNLYSVTYVDVAPDASPRAAALLRQLRQSSRQEGGNLEFAVLQETTRPNRFAIFEGWRDQPAFDAHSRSPGLAEFQRAIAGFSIAPSFQIQPFAAFVTAAPAGKPGPGSVYMVEHMDCWPPFTAKAEPLVRALAAGNESQPGTIRYDAYQWRGHHYTVVAIWRDAAAYHASESSPATRDFRRATEVAGGRVDRYDARLYRPVD